MSEPTSTKLEPTLTELKPYPFCGGKAEFRDGSSTVPYIRCKKCGGRTMSSYNSAKLKAAWNRRVDA